MPKTQHAFDRYSLPELESQASQYCNKKGRFTLGMIYVPLAADMTFVGLLALVGVIFGAHYWVFNTAHALWSSTHIFSLFFFEIYPLCAALLVGLYIIGARMDAVKEYLRLKGAIKDRLIFEALTESTV